MNRKPPKEVRRQLRNEVNYGCPVNGCNNPYLYWHHFDPKWNEKEHHNPNGMIALCAEHHAKADAGTYTNEQLRSMKKRSSIEPVKGSFDWMRSDILAVVGSNFYYNTPLVLQIHKNPVIWFNRDEHGYMLLNVNMPTTSGNKRLQLEDNFWINTGDTTDFEAAPSGKLIHAKYKNGDELTIEFNEIKTEIDFVKKYSCKSHSVKYPLTAIEIYCKIVDAFGKSLIELTPKYTNLLGIQMINNWIVNCAVGVNVT